MLNIFYPRTQIGFHVELDPDIRRSTGFTFKLSMYKNSPVDSIAINSLFNDVTIENITPTTATYQVVQHTPLKRARRDKTQRKIQQKPTSLPKPWSPPRANRRPSTTPSPWPPQANKQPSQQPSPWPLKQRPLQPKTSTSPARLKWSSTRSRKQFLDKKLPRCIGETTYQHYIKARNCLYCNLRQITSPFGGSQHGHHGMIMPTAKYFNIASSAWQVPPIQPAVPVIPDGATPNQRSTIFNQWSVGRG